MNVMVLGLLLVQFVVSITKGIDMAQQVEVNWINYKYLTSLIERLDWCYKHDAIHCKRGFRINDARPSTASNHFIEEVVEFQAEVLNGNKEKMVEEAGDVLALLLLNLHYNGITLEEVAEASYKKQLRIWVIDQKLVTTTTPGFNRSNRA